MNSYCYLALVAALPLGLYACATAVEIEDSVVLVAATEFSNLPANTGDAGPPANLNGTPGEASGAGGTGAGPSPQNTAGTTMGAQTAADTGGQGGSAGGSMVEPSGGGMQSSAGAGGMPMGGEEATSGDDTEPPVEDPEPPVEAEPDPPVEPPEEVLGVFDAAACDFTDDTGCEDLGCDTCQNCQDRCTDIEACVTTDPECVITEADPLCALRDVGAPNTCTQEVDSGGGVNNVNATEPAGIMLEWVTCMCQTGRLD